MTNMMMNCPSQPDREKIFEIMGNLLKAINANNLASIELATFDGCFDAKDGAQETAKKILIVMGVSIDMIN